MFLYSTRLLNQSVSTSHTTDDLVVWNIAPDAAVIQAFASIMFSILLTATCERDKVKSSFNRSITTKSVGSISFNSAYVQ